MDTARHRQRKIVEEIRRIRDELHKIAASLHPQSDVHQRAVAEKKIIELEKRITELEERQQRRF